MDQRGTTKLKNQAKKKRINNSSASSAQPRTAVCGVLKTARLGTHKQGMSDGSGNGDRQETGKTESGKQSCFEIWKVEGRKVPHKVKTAGVSGQTKRPQSWQCHSARRVGWLFQGASGAVSTWSPVVDTAEKVKWPLGNPRVDLRAFASSHVSQETRTLRPEQIEGHPQHPAVPLRFSETCLIPLSTRPLRAQGV